MPVMVKAPGQTERKYIREPIQETAFGQVPGFPSAEQPNASRAGR